MTVAASGLFYPTWRDILDTSQLAIDLDLETHKVALFTNTVTPSFSTDTAYLAGNFAANQVAGTGYSSGGKVITGTAISEAPTGTLMWDGTDVAWTGATFSSARCGFIYADASTGNNAILLVNFGGDYQVSSGTFTIQWSTAGIFSLDLTP